MAVTSAPTRTKARSSIRRWLTRLAVGLGVLLAAAAGYFFWPERAAPLRAAVNPAASYAEAEARLRALASRSETEALHPQCHLRFLGHGQRQPRTIVLVHGYSACPQQFAALGEQFFALGYNVVIAPLPRHGLADRLTELHSGLTAEELAAYTDEVVDLAQGLGEHVTVLGISGGGIVTGWAAQERADVDLAVLIAPGFGFEVVPTALTRPALRLYQLLPNKYEWWDPVVQAGDPRAPGYPRYSTRALAQILRLGDAIRTGAGQAPPAAGRVVVVTNANDHRVNNPLTALVAETWRRHGGNVVTYEFPAELGLEHDLIDPYPPSPHTPEVYAKLIELVEE
jgi:carboxylesterase